MDNLNTGRGTSMRMSVSEGVRFERNGSIMHTMIESLEDSSFSGTGMSSSKEFHPLTKSKHREEYYGETSVCL